MRKANKAVDAVLEQLAPGQGDVLKQELFRQLVEVDVVEELNGAVRNAVGNVKVQLLSLIAGKKEGKYQYTINELQTMFPGTTKHYIGRARKHAKNRKIGIPIKPGKY